MVRYGISVWLLSIPDTVGQQERAGHGFRHAPESGRGIPGGTRTFGGLLKRFLIPGNLHTHHRS